MEIEVKRGHFKTLNFKDVNIDCEVNISEGLYGLKEDGKKDFSKKLGLDITDEGLSILASPLEDLFYYRIRDFDSRALIAQAFEKLSEEHQKELLEELNNDYGKL